MTFIELCRKGKATADDIDDYIEIWHTTTTEDSLQEFLGLTDDQYSAFIRGEIDIQQIIDMEI